MDGGAGDPGVAHQGGPADEHGTGVRAAGPVTRYGSSPGPTAASTVLTGVAADRSARTGPPVALTDEGTRPATATAVPAGGQDVTGHRRVRRPP
ncbi:hypothetical protein GCM10010512_21840 [Streptomyces thermoviolaceus subsp. thermoviolaceus]|nr:hypothetical protein GCM10010499_06730 [Streptomyces thermoviolaceus subsp. apingens]GHA90104.1 hypothetical protein GCM10010512_21840 [Streptomyces thermoviolaceus subsp. thermoviolaceus]